MTAIHIPSEAEEAVRHLLRCREDINADLLRAKHRLSQFLLRHGRRCLDAKPWSKRYFAWLVGQRWTLAALEQTFVSYRRGIDDLSALTIATELGDPARFAIRCAWVAQHRPPRAIPAPRGAGEAAAVGGHGRRP